MSHKPKIKIKKSLTCFDITNYCIIFVHFFWKSDKSNLFGLFDFSESKLVKY